VFSKPLDFSLRISLPLFLLLLVFLVSFYSTDIYSTDLLIMQQKTPVQFNRLKMVAREDIKKQFAPWNPAEVVQ